MREYLEALRRFYIDLWNFHLQAAILLQRESSEEVWRKVVADGSALSIRHGDTDFTAMMIRNVIDELERVQKRGGS